MEWYYIATIWLVYLIGVVYFGVGFRKKKFQGKPIPELTGIFMAVFWPLCIAFSILLSPLGIAGYFLKKYVKKYEEEDDQ